MVRTLNIFKRPWRANRSTRRWYTASRQRSARQAAFNKNRGPGFSRAAARARLASNAAALARHAIWRRILTNRLAARARRAALATARAPRRLVVYRRR